jgi:hypothetical protein
VESLSPIPSNQTVLFNNGYTLDSICQGKGTIAWSVAVSISLAFGRHLQQRVSQAAPFPVAGVRRRSVNAPTLLRLSLTKLDPFRSALQQK